MESSGKPQVTVKSSNIDVIKKPRTLYSNRVLKMTQPNLDLQKKMQSITMGKLKGFTFLHIKKDGEQHFQKAYTVDAIPKVLTIVDSSQLAEHQKQRAAQKKEKHQEKEHKEGKEFDRQSSGSSISGEHEYDDEVAYQEILSKQMGFNDLSKNIDTLIESDKETIDLLRMCKKFSVPSMEELKDKFYNLGEKTRNKVLVLDMDETLIHARYLLEESELANDNGDFHVNIQSKSNDESVKISVKMRPHLDSCLEYLEKMYEIVVFTAGEQAYADAVLDYIDEERKIIKHRLYRQHCVKKEECFYVKDLRIIQDRPLSDIIIVDNSIISFAFNIDNGVPIGAFLRQEKDEELLYLVSLLEEIYSYKDVREHIAKTMKLKEHMEKC